MKQAAWFFVTFCVAIVSAQDPRGSIMGRVTDASNAVIPNVEVRVKNNETGVTASARSNASGVYVVPFLLPAKYEVSAELTGFKRIVRDRIEVRVSETVELNLEMEVGT